MDMGFKLDNGLLRKHMEDDFAFACMFGSFAGVEDAMMYGNKGIVEVGLEDAVSVAVDDVKGFELCDEDMIRSKTKGPLEGR
jgi:hypothetical protein